MSFTTDFKDIIVFEYNFIALLQIDLGWFVQSNVLPSLFKPGSPPGLILEKLQATWLEKHVAIHEDMVLPSLHYLFSIFVC